jgi:hypothetical protein
MIDESLSRQISRNNRNILMLCSVAIAAVLLTAMAYRQYLRSIISPVAIGSAELESPASSNPYLDTFVKIPAGEPIGTDVEAHAENSNRVIANLVGVRIGDRYLVAEIPTGKIPQILTGKLVEIPQDVQATLFSNSPGSNPELNARHYPFVLDVTADRSEDGPEILVLGLIFVMSAVYFAQSLYRIAVPEAHPAMKALRYYGDPGAISAQLAQELRIEGDREKYGEARVTSRWLVQITAFKTDIIRLSDIAWAYPKVIKHYTSFIPTGKTYFVVVHDRHGQRFEVGAAKDSVPVFLRSVQLKTPWAIFGFSEPLKKAWEKNRAQFLRNVDSRRQAISAEAEKAAAAQPVRTLVGA